MKKILILAYDFPPYNSVGAQRPFSWLKYFPESNVYPIVVTRNWDNIVYGDLDAYTKATKPEVKHEINDKYSIYFVPYSPNLRDKLLLRSNFLIVFLRKFLTIFFRIGKFLSHKLDNRSAIYFQAKDVIKQHQKIDYIISTGEPFILFKYAHLLSKEFNIPWHADYRDDWIKNHTESGRIGLTPLILRIERLFEKKYLSNVSSITSVSDFILNEIQKRTGKDSCLVIENGADISAFKKINFKKSSHFLISYTGIMYDFKYMDIFFEGFSMFLEKYHFDKDIKMRFVGIEAQMNQAVRKAHLMKELFPNHVEILGRVSTEKAIEFQLESSVLLNLIAGDPSKGLVGAKCYSYAATRNPILSVSTINSKSTFFFPNRNIHTIAVNSQEVFDFLSQLYRRFKNGEDTSTDITEEEIFCLSREYNSIKLIGFLEKNSVVS